MLIIVGKGESMPPPADAERRTALAAVLAYLAGPGVASAALRPPDPGMLLGAPTLRRAERTLATLHVPSPDAILDPLHTSGALQTAGLRNDMAASLLEPLGGVLPSTPTVTSIGRPTLQQLTHQGFLQLQATLLADAANGGSTAAVFTLVPVDEPATFAPSTEFAEWRKQLLALAFALLVSAGAGGAATTSQEAVDAIQTAADIFTVLFLLSERVGPKPEKDSKHDRDEPPSSK
jgi:hypothetical protein